MANLLWSYATLGSYPGEQLLESMVLHMLQRIQTYRPQAISNSLWAFAKARPSLPTPSTRSLAVTREPAPGLRSIGGRP